MSRLSVDKITLELTREEAIHICCAVARDLPPRESEKGKQNNNLKMRATIIYLLSVVYGCDATSLVDGYAKEESN